MESSSKNRPFDVSVANTKRKEESEKSEPLGRYNVESHRFTVTQLRHLQYAHIIMAGYGVFSSRFNKQDCQYATNR